MKGQRCVYPAAMTVGVTDAGWALYSATALRFYDPLILGVYGPVVWRCSTRDLTEHYRRALSPRHLDVGPGTGSFLDRADPPLHTRITLLDPHPDVLAHASRRLARWQPAAVQANVLLPLPLTDQFDSAALNYVLHCLPGPLERKAAAVRHVARVLTPQGVLFGATVLGIAGPHTPLLRAVLWFVNRQHYFDNLGDTEQGLRDLLMASFREVDIRVQGAVAVFAARHPRDTEKA